MRGKEYIAQLDRAIAAEQQEIDFADLLASLVEHPGWLELMKRAEIHRQTIQADINNPLLAENVRQWRLGEAVGLEWMMKRARVTIGARGQFVENRERHQAQKEKGGMG